MFHLLENVLSFRSSCCHPVAGDQSDAHALCDGLLYSGSSGSPPSVG